MKGEKITQYYLTETLVCHSSNKDTFFLQNTHLDFVNSQKNETKKLPRSVSFEQKTRLKSHISKNIEKTTTKTLESVL